MRIHQLCARLEYGDAVSNHVLEIDRALASWGYETRIFANTRDRFGTQVALPDSEYSRFAGSRGDVLIYHHSVYCTNYRQYLKTRNRRILIYHNITPPEFFSPYDKGVAEFCRLGRELLPELIESDLALGDSEFNRMELLEAGFDPERTGVLPVFVDYPGLLARRGKPAPGADPGVFNVLFVGRRVPNKRIDDVIRAFFYYNRCINAESHLYIAGAHWVDRYDAQLRWLIDSFGLWDRVHMTGRVSDEELAGYYRSADLFLCMSEHEGFGVPLVECMAFEVPVLAYASTAVPFTLGGAGITFDRKEFPPVGELMEVLRVDDTLREKVLETERERLKRFSPEAVREDLRAAVGRVVEDR